MHSIEPILSSDVAAAKQQNKYVIRKEKHYKNRIPLE